MSAIAFDTHAFVKRLVNAGMPEAQAEVLADEQTKLIEIQFATAATKTDIREAVLTLEAKIEASKANIRDAVMMLEARIEATKADVREVVLTLEARIETTKADLLKWIVGAIGLQTMVIIGAVIALARIAK